MNKYSKQCLVIIGVLIIIFTSTIILSVGCGNKQMFDTTKTFDKAIICLPNGEIIEGEVQSWTDFEDGDQLQVKINDKTYLVHSTNIALIHE